MIGHLDDAVRDDVCDVCFDNDITVSTPCFDEVSLLDAVALGQRRVHLGDRSDAVAALFDSF